MLKASLNTCVRVLIVFMMLTLTGCSFINGIVQRHVGDLITKDLILLNAKSYGEAVAISQRVNVDITSNVFSLIQQVEIDDDEIRLVGVTHFGSPIFTLRYQEGIIESTKMEMLPEAFRPELVLRDFQFAFWNFDALQKAYQKIGHLVIENGLTRILQQEGKGMITVTYQKNNRLNGRVLLVHHELGYQVIFETLDVKRLEGE